MISGRIESGMRDPDDGIPNRRRFSTSGNAEHILLTLDHVSFTTCARQCHETENCLGFFYLLQGGRLRCRLLDDLGVEGGVLTRGTSVSYAFSPATPTTQAPAETEEDVSQVFTAAPTEVGSKHLIFSGKKMVLDNGLSLLHLVSYIRCTRRTI